eukprot:6930737-Ditylum_brightwellii.AAC.1
MIVQLGDTFDLLFEGFGTNYDIIFLFDHSCNHDRMHPDALNANAMNDYFDGQVGTSLMHSSEIKDVKYVYLYMKQFKVGNIQQFHFIADGEGPFHCHQKKEKIK